MSHRQDVSPNVREYIQKEIEPFKWVFDLIQENVVVTDAAGIIVYANKATFKKTGYLEGEVLGKKPGELWGGQMEPVFYAEMWKAIGEEKKPWSGEIKNRTKQGETFWVNLQISPVFDGSNEVLFYLALEPDITNRMNLLAKAENNSELLKRMDDFMIAREIKMVKLKEEVATLKNLLASAAKTTVS